MVSVTDYTHQQIVFQFFCKIDNLQRQERDFIETAVHDPTAKRIFLCSAP